MEIIYQKNKDKQPVYDMYQKIFEDPEPFAQYYFEEIYATNQVILAEEDNKILGMLHLNPYHIRAGKKTYTLNYIVAVAVWKEYRRRGIMAEMLKKCFNDMHEQQQPFTYLMPANKEGNLFKGNSTGKDFIQSKKVPKIMARITNLTAWGDILQGKNDFTFRILVKDPYIKDQNGVFQFQCLNHKISIQRADIPQDETLDIHTTDAQGWKDEISIDELTQVFFDYDAGQILKEHEYLKDIVPAGPIYISEEV